MVLSQKDEHKTVNILDVLKKPLPKASKMWVRNKWESNCTTWNESGHNLESLDSWLLLVQVELQKNSHGYKWMLILRLCHLSQVEVTLRQEISVHLVTTVVTEWLPPESSGVAKHTLGSKENISFIRDCTVNCVYITVFENPYI